MLWFIRAITLVVHGILLQFLQLLGFIGLGAAMTAGFMRGPWWLVGVIAAGFALLAEWLPRMEVEWLAKASSSSERTGFLVIVYFVISFVGYFAGRYLRHAWDKRRKTAATNM